ncbi:class C beta-lactamase [Pseudomonas viridiflava]|uniref:class C beta-lactamase n=1 Tax=Pseudomonas viridiflava TaxID=33069 RepID=UPI002EA208B8|nr:class C beta-lactamase [Pseudomonas viridiflava]MEE3975535.1 class C beta-lactamase [Pseudomonas viridiflava]MEE4020324.1 class C beta-lactamase [Pseudomonas viridiflava]MEE4048460.1 class C beta-lactamase [Pseudomonas viridiflava]
MQWNQKRSLQTVLLTSLTLTSSLALAQEQNPKLDDFVRENASKVMQENGIAGLSIAITHNGKQQFYTYGKASKDAVQAITPDTLFELGSISKTFTATLATWAQANGQLSLTERIDTYVPQLRDTRLGKVPVFNLGTHTAGGFPLQFPDKVQTTGQMMAYFKAWQPDYLPGTYRSYANPSVGLLGLVAARSMKVPFDAAMQQRLLPALGLKNTYLTVPEAQMSRYAQGYNKLDEPVRVNPGVLASEAYGVKSSSRDVLAFIEANMGLGQYEAPLQQALKDTRTGYFRVGGMTQDLIWEQYPMPVKLDTLLEGNASNMVLQTQKAEPITPPLAAQSNTWINKTGSTNGFGGYVAFIPEQQLGIVILANRNYPNEERVKLAYRILNQVQCFDCKP